MRLSSCAPEKNWKMTQRKVMQNNCLNAGLSQAGGGQIFAEPLTLSQSGGQIMPTTVLQAPPPHFQTLRRLWIVIDVTKSE